VFDVDNAFICRVSDENPGGIGMVKGKEVDLAGE